ncbi:actin-histidine N-methyltransferase [Bombus vosnesenskii]|uniref:protein-histidine N-methyltransferase n=1 Tax=Bombus vosnesenskii TaxID=207650 RepID=A0A6J3KG64_9HYME|nr:actin-histidine N-methyltransferase [Bombus vosnesenskii]XP_050476459.1 actin-histidine N-methyltransferase [Bombus huntii]
MDRRNSDGSFTSEELVLYQRQLTKLENRNVINALCQRLFILCFNSVCETQLWNNYVEISTVLEKVKQLEEMKTESPKRSQGIGRFINWLKQNGANVYGASVAEFPGYDLGLKAERNFLENELILRIPRELIFSIHNAAPELVALQNDPLLQLMPQVALAIALLIEKHKEYSKWKPYLDILPTTYTTVLYMTAADMNELKGSPTLEAALKQCRNIARQYAYFNKLFQKNNNAVSAILRDVFTYEKYCWAVSTVMTRQNIIPSKDGSLMIHALIPMWDMCNHENSKITTDFNATLNCCECYALRDFKKAEQIFISYGARTNSDFFVHSGFVYMDNEQDGFKLRLGISKADPLQKERVELLNKLDLPAVGEFLLKPGTEPISDTLLAFLRVFSMRKEELAHWIQSDRVNDLKHMDCALETVVEENVKKFLLTRLQLLIANYPTTLKEDLQLLETTLPRIKKLAIQLRVTEKRILQGALEYVQQWIKA